MFCWIGWRLARLPSIYSDTIQYIMKATGFSPSATTNSKIKLSQQLRASFGATEVYSATRGSDCRRSGGCKVRWKSAGGHNQHLWRVSNLNDGLKEAKLYGFRNQFSEFLHKFSLKSTSIDHQSWTESPWILSPAIVPKESKDPRSIMAAFPCQENMVMSLVGHISWGKCAHVRHLVLVFPLKWAQGLSTVVKNPILDTWNVLNRITSRVLW